MIFSKLTDRLKFDFSKITPEMEDMSLCKMFSLCDLDRLFEQTPNARILNNDSLIAKKLSKEYSDAIYSNVDNDLAFVPSCECGAVRGVSFQGLTCNKCGSICSLKFVDELTNNSWIGIPEGLPSVLHPVWYLALKNWTKLGNKGQTAIDIILDPEAEVPEDLYQYISGRGFQYFYENTDEVMNMLLYQYPRTMKKDTARTIAAFYKEYRHCMFTRKLPILHSSLHPMKSNGGGLVYVDNTSKEILPAVINMSDLTFKRHAVRMSQKQENRELFKVYTQIISYYQLLVKEKLGGKPGLLRKHCSGSRLHFSSRAVIVPHNKVLPFDEVELPWGMMLVTLKSYLMNILVNRRHLSVAEALNKHTAALVNYDPEIAECLDIIISEFPTGRVPFLIGRNPTLAFGSMAVFYCKRYKTNPHDETIGINACIVGPSNADFDGDELYAIMLMENALRLLLMNTHSSIFMLSANRPGVSDRIGLLKQNTIAFENYQEEDPDIDHFERLQ